MEPLKVIFLGEGDVGKASIISKFTQQRTQLISKTIIVNNQSINLDIWDWRARKIKSIIKKFL